MNTIGEEDFNQPSPERVDLLKRLHEKISKFAEAAGIPLHFWAACQVCDLGALAKLVDDSTSPYFIISILSQTSQMVRHCKSNGLILLL